MPTEYHAEVLGAAEAQLDLRWRVAGLALAVAIGVFLLLQAAFSSWRLAAAVFLTLPLAAAGGVLAAFFVGGDRDARRAWPGLLTRDRHRRPQPTSC